MHELIMKHITKKGKKIQVWIFVLFYNIYDACLEVSAYDAYLEDKCPWSLLTYLSCNKIYCVKKIINVFTNTNNWNPKRKS